MPLSFKVAVECWCRLHPLEKDDPKIWDTFMRAETRILSRKPRTIDEICDIIDVVLDQIEGRCDGLDVRALENIKKHLKNYIPEKMKIRQIAQIERGVIGTA
ncbi:hypothetical protein D3C85_999110 [compost metagenome]